jgi:hypothetical protein
MDNAQTSFGSRLARAFRNIVLLALFLGLAGAAVWASSVVNSRTYSLEVINGQLVVLKGRMFPVGSEPWTPGDGVLSDAYAPLDLLGNSSLTVVGQRFGERDELDRALFKVIEMLARPRVNSDAPRDLDRALALIRRGEKLKGLSDEQRVTLRTLQSEVAFFLSQQRLDDARKQLEEALTQLKLAAESDSRHKNEAGLMLLAVEPQVKLLATTLRATTTMSKSGDGQASNLSNLARALEPQLKAVFESLQSGAPAVPPVAPAPSQAPAPAAAPTDGQPASR